MIKDHRIADQTHILVQIYSLVVVLQVQLVQLVQRAAQVLPDLLAQPAAQAPRALKVFQEKLLILEQQVQLVKLDRLDIQVPLVRLDVQVRLDGLEQPDGQDHEV